MFGAGGVRVSRMISTVVLLIVTLVVGILFYRVMVGFFVPLFLAALLVVIFRPVHEWIGQRLGKRRQLAALATTTLILMVVLVPAFLVIGVAAAQGTGLLSRVNYNSLAFALQRTRVQLGLEIKNSEPFNRMVYLIHSLGEIDNIAEERDLRAPKDRFREFRQVLKTLESDFEPLGTVEQQALEDTYAKLDLLYLKLLAIVEEPKTSPPTDAVAPDQAAGSAELQANTPATDVPTGQSETGEIAVGGGEEAAEVPVDANFDYRSPAEQYQRALVALDTQVRTLTNSLLGGPVRAQLKIWANPSEDEITALTASAQEYWQPRLLRLTSATGEFLLQTLIGISILTIALYFFLVDGPDMIRTLMKLSPLDDRYELRLLLEFDQTSRAVVLATVLSALAQGVLAVFGYYFAGLGSIILLFLLTTFMALIPFLGAAAIWIPCALWLGLVEERWGAAIGLAIYGATIVSTIDNVIKVFVLHGRSQLHPLLALLSVLGGVQVFGPIGILVGPMVVVFLQTTLEILNHELSAYETSESGESSDSSGNDGLSETAETGEADKTSKTGQSSESQIPLALAAADGVDTANNPGDPPEK